VSLSSICKSVLAETGWTVLSTIASNSDGTAVQIKELAITELENLSQQYDWPQLEVAYSFDTVVGQLNYVMPDDFNKMVTDSVFNASQYYSIRGSIEIQEWQYRRNGMYASLDRQHYRLTFNGVNFVLELAAPPTQVETLLLEYQTTEYARAANGTSKPVYELDDDVSKVPENLIKLGLKWRFRMAKGMDYSAALSEYNNTLKQRFANVHNAASIPVGGRRLLDTNPVTSGYVRDTGFGQ
jgi:hypothetical protein